MNKKLDQIFSFRDEKVSKTITKVLMGVLLACSLAVLILILVFGGGKDGKDASRPYVFSIIPLILAFSLFKKNDYMFLLAEFVTIIADIFMILLKNLNVGILIYLVVQLIYAVYFYFRDESKKRSLIMIIVRVALMLIIPFILLGINKLTARNAFAFIYFINILVNIAYAIIFKDPILIVGFAIFAVSDLFIGLDMLKVSFATKILEKFNAVYFLYIISQVVLVFNTYNANYICNKK